jgi:hypothetical protein
MRAQATETEFAERDEEDAPFDMANLYPRDTGLPMTIWVSPKGRARHDVRIKVCTIPGDRMDATNTAVVAVQPRPKVLHGELSRSDAELVSRWIDANATALIGYWEGQLSTVEFVFGLKKL